MHGSYIERYVETPIFEDFKKLSLPLSVGKSSVVLEQDELEIDESLMFAIYNKFVRDQDNNDELLEVEKFRAVLAEIVDELYTGPAVDYVVLNNMAKTRT